MANVPEGAQLSEDGRWWWDGQQWQPVEDGDAGHGAAPADPVAVNDGVSDPERAAARVAAGLPASLHDLTDEQRAPYVQRTTGTESLAYDVVDVPEIEDHDGEQGVA
jgi:hypothetical protein